jgi:hypothetical protein
MLALGEVLWTPVRIAKLNEGLTAGPFLSRINARPGRKTAGGFGGVCGPFIPGGSSSRLWTPSGEVGFKLDYWEIVRLTLIRAAVPLLMWQSSHQYPRSASVSFTEASS